MFIRWSFGKFLFVSIFFPLHWLQLSIDSSEASGKIFSLFAQSEGPSNDVFLKIEKKNESGLKLTHNIIKFKFNRMIELFKFDFYVIWTVK